jgi:hypothetical protein
MIYFKDFLFDFVFIDPSRSRCGFIGGVGRWTLSQTTICNGSIPLLPFIVEELLLLCPINVVVDNEFGIGNGVCFFTKCW